MSVANANTPPSSTTEPRAPSSGRVARRAVLALGAVTVCGAGALVAPQAIPRMEQAAQNAAATALQNEVNSLEGVSLDAAIRAAELTRAAVQLLVLPLARFVALVGGDALAAAIAALDLARNALGFVGVHNSVLDAIRDLFVSWQGNVSGLPISLNAYATADITSAEKYLKSLKAKTKQS